MPDVHQAELDGAAVYSPAMLAVYDLYVLRLSNALAWRCSRERLLAHYDAHVSRRHLDIGPGSGWYLRHARFPTDRPEVTLMDLNPTPMRTATRRLAERGITPRSHVGSILQPIAPSLGRFDSVAASFVFHCVPGTWSEKGRAFEHIAAALDDGGVFFGSTILNVGVPRNVAARALTRLYNRRLHVFHNESDDLPGLRAAIERAFDDVTVDVVGMVAIFSARRPRRGPQPE